MMETDFLVVGAGIVGLSIARELARRFPGAGAIVIDKEPVAAFHASGRNSGVVHAGFYYTTGSVKALLTAKGNEELTNYCLEHGLPINQCGKVVVAVNEEEVQGIHELKRRGDANGAKLRLLDEKELAEVEPNARTRHVALFSPATSSIDPLRVCQHIADSFPPNVKLLYGCPLTGVEGKLARTGKGTIRFRHLFNASGLHADKIAHMFGVGRRYTMLPFKGLYLKHNDTRFLRRHVYPVPNLRNPFLGVHFTITVEGRIKIGPTAIPAFWRENYDFTHRFDVGELAEIFTWQTRLFAGNHFGFRQLAFEEIMKYHRARFIDQAKKLVYHLDAGNFGHYTKPGIRAQLLDVAGRQLVMDFVVENGERSTHVLNAVSPAFTSAFPFARLVVDAASPHIDSA